jgi:Kef-type K+ transport system membrane component KefB
MFDLLPAAAAPQDHSIAVLMTGLAAVLILAKILGSLARRLGQPSVLGELLAGVALGPSALGLIDPANPVWFTLGELGLVVLLFQIGLHTSLREILKVGTPAAVVGIAGVVLPFLSGYLVAMALGVGGLTAIVCGAALTATSIGISARVLSDLGQLTTPEGRIVLGAAVLDDIIGLVILTVVAGIAAGDGITLMGIGRAAGLSIGFLIGAIALGLLFAPRLMNWVATFRVAGAQGSVALAVALALAALATAVGSSMIIGAFAAGVVIHTTRHARSIEQSSASVGHFFVPLFFAIVGASIKLEALLDTSVLLIGGALCVVAIIGKLAAGFAPWWFQGNKLLIGVAMIPRGEVGLIFAQMGLATGALDDGLFSAVVLMVMVTTFIAPPWLAQLGKGVEGPPDESTLDELVYGEDEPY